MTYYFTFTITITIFCLSCYVITTLIKSKYHIDTNESKIKQGTSTLPGYDKSPFDIAEEQSFIAERYVANFIYRNKRPHSRANIKDTFQHRTVLLYAAILLITIHSMVSSFESDQYEDWIYFILLTAFLQLNNLLMLNKFIKETLPTITIFYFLKKKKLNKRNINKIFNILFYQHEKPTYCMLDKFIFLFYHANDQNLLLSLINKLKKHETSRQLALTLWAFKKQTSPLNLLTEPSMKEYQQDLIYISGKHSDEIMQDCTRDCRAHFILKDILESSKS